VFYVEAGNKRIEVSFGPKYTVAIVYAPPGHDYICFEPMTAITNGINLAHEGKYPELQTVAPGSRWSESFRILPVGF
jgi:aldose 1-epimerase